LLIATEIFTTNHQPNNMMGGIGALQFHETVFCEEIAHAPAPALSKPKWLGCMIIPGGGKPVSFHLG
jgi:hypothetical protein